MSKNNTRRRKIKKTLAQVEKNKLVLFPHQLEALKALMKPKVVRDTRFFAPQRMGMSTILGAAKRSNDALDGGVRMGDMFALFASKDDPRDLLIQPLKKREGVEGLCEVTYDKWEPRILSALEDEVRNGPPARDENGNPVWRDSLILKNGRHPLAGEYGKLCYRTCCQRPNAVWWNRGSYHYYCEDCAIMLNRENRRSWRELQESYAPEHRKDGEMCIKLGPDDEHPVPL